MVIVKLQLILNTCSKDHSGSDVNRKTVNLYTTVCVLFHSLFSFIFIFCLLGFSLAVWSGLGTTIIVGSRSCLNVANKHPFIGCLSEMLVTE